MKTITTISFAVFVVVTALVFFPSKTDTATVIESTEQTVLTKERYLYVFSGDNLQVTAPAQEVNAHMVHTVKLDNLYFIGLNKY
jgi:hypothetical protein